MGNISVIGPRGAGKTTYLAALAYSLEHGDQKSKTKKFTIIPQNEESRKLAEQADNILRSGAELEATRLIEDEENQLADLPYYLFKIKYKAGSKAREISLTTKDYPGECFDKVANHDGSSQFTENFIKDCTTDVVGCLIFLTAWESNMDAYYNRFVTNFLRNVPGDRLSKLKLAVAMTKCERGEIWPGRNDPEKDLFGLYLKQTTNTLRSKLPGEKVRFFAMSTFGVLAIKDPRPNRIDRLKIHDREPGAVLREPAYWQPYNLIEPLYWLNT
ncbi:MAG: hypothetical protein N5P05_002677 [Chroococcopsis gigantea SAG 12.99]|jgi:tRNA A37 threonylcarbamoyladenosine biosynthesis protein TsaE|nr:hypothetical protein [Chlorogloea purpurea SAG 13.99]MDV3001071.1 hypothetical protein [Chroococcopsis gigantea SAG 12.99]